MCLWAICACSVSSIPFVSLYSFFLWVLLFHPFKFVVFNVGWQCYWVLVMPSGCFSFIIFLYLLFSFQYNLLNLIVLCGRRLSVVDPRPTKTIICLFVNSFNLLNSALMMYVFGFGFLCFQGFVR
uniref:Uncharacterized protein n=1 Tax=Kalanchoe fedtschenkoi TaxID=63787 RepID=A0A7N0UHT0_KALFE